jgi:hypothetical protein
MKVQNMKRQLRLREWASQVKECSQSGQSVKQWCMANGVNIKTYYNRLSKVREEMLEALENAKPVTPSLSNIEATGLIRKPMQPPVFTPLPISPRVKPAITVRMGSYAVEIEDGTNSSTIEHVLQAVSQL